MNPNKHKKQTENSTSRHCAAVRSGHVVDGVCARVEVVEEEGGTEVLKDELGREGGPLLWRRGPCVVQTH